MTRWEYTAEPLPETEPAKPGESADMSRLLQLFNGLGADGWEYVGIVTHISPPNPIRNTGPQATPFALFRRQMKADCPCPAKEASRIVS